MMMNQKISNVNPIKRKYLTFEIFIALLLTLNLFLQEFVSNTTIALILIALFIAKGMFEGYRMCSFFYGISLILLLLENYIADISALIISLFNIWYFPYYDYPTPFGPFMVGYRRFLIDSEVEISVFYPTNEPGPDEYVLSPNDHPWEHVKESAKLVGANVPTFIAKFITSSLHFRKLNVNTNAPIISKTLLSRNKDEQKFPAIVFSHGLASSRNSYAMYTREWASKGFIVVSVEHKTDEICPSSKKIEDFPVRNRDLKVRSKQLSKAFDFLYNADLLRTFFADHEVEIDKSNISAAGHSFGGATAIYTTQKDERITGACICLDPWLYPLDEECYTSLNLPLLILRAEYFEQTVPGNRDRVLRLARCNKKFLNQTLVCHFEKSGHNNLSDNGLFMAREMSFSKQLAPVSLNEGQYINHLSLVNSFIDVMLLDRKLKTAMIKENVVKAYEQKFHSNDIALIFDDF